MYRASRNKMSVMGDFYYRNMVDGTGVVGDLEAGNFPSCIG